MESIDLLKAKINLQTTILKFTSSIQELQEKHPDRKDLINSMLNSLQDISEFQSIFLELEENFILECKANLRLQMQISENKHVIDKLKIQLKIQQEGL
tara:strand:- start:8737 stop:9030 length:294 start_codon:yes stop_codon:yes gene_type:complete